MNSLLLTLAMCLGAPQTEPIQWPSTVFTVNQVAPQVKGKFIPITTDNIVLNSGRNGGNCAWASAETLARHLKLTRLHGMSNDKGYARWYSSSNGQGWSDVSRFVKDRGIEYSEVTGNKRAGWDLIVECLEDNKPVLVSIPKHAVVCNGMTTAADGKRYVWIIDNSGSERAKAKGWEADEFYAHFTGWVFCPGRRRGQPCPAPNSPAPHVNPTPDTVPGTPPAVPTVPKPDANTDILKAIADLKAEIANIALKPGPPGADGKPGIPGPAGKDGAIGPAGPAGAGADNAVVVALQNEIAALKNKLATPQTAQLLDINGNVLQTVEFGPGLPLKLRLVPVTPPK